MTAYPTITLWQPWATLVAYDCKPFEFRSWAAPRGLIGRRVAVHASVRKPSMVEVRALLVKLHSAAWRETGLRRDLAIQVLEALKADLSDMPRGAVMCLATLGQPIRNNELAAALGLEHVNDSNRGEHSNWGWPLTDVQRLEPSVPAKGSQGWWTWQHDLVAA